MPARRGARQAAPKSLTGGSGRRKIVKRNWSIRAGSAARRSGADALMFE